MSKDEIDDPDFTFHHPYVPYSIQIDFMKNLYDTLQNFKIGIFESPTGTGKTLSLICASMTWLRRDRRNDIYGDSQAGIQGDEPEWVQVESRRAKREEAERRIRDFEIKLQKLKQSGSSHIRDSSRETKKPRTDLPDPLKNFLLDEVDEVLKKPESGLNTEVQLLLNKLTDQNEYLKNSSESTVDVPKKIFFTSRTHSQLSQFTGQLKNTSFPSSIDIEGFSEEIKQISMGSRKQLCINPKVSKLGSVTQINNACLDLQKSTDSKCEFLNQGHSLQSKMELEAFQNKALAQVRDIEDLAELGRQSCICPYYGVRGDALNRSEIVTLPYQLLLQQSSRQALNIDIKDSIVIIDEAHNLLDVISSLNSVSISFYEAEMALSGLKIYERKFYSRLSMQNKRNFSQTVKVVESLVQYLKKATELPAKDVAPGTKIQIGDIFGSSTGDLVNTYKLEKFLRKSKLAFKIDSYLDAAAKEAGKKSMGEKLILSKVVQFLLAITNPASEGDLFFGRSDDAKLILQYLLLDPSIVFKSIVEDAKCVILAGGTMEPMSDYLNYLFPYVPREKIKMFSCGHIIPKQNLTVATVKSGHGEKFLFTFATRNNSQLLIALGKTILDLIRAIPGGVVVFFPSYAHLDSLSLWEKNGLLNQIKTVKPVFLEQKDHAVDTTLAKYDRAIQKTGGALLFAVVGGKMSEGINFSDDRARAVIMVGLPFPNMYSAEMTAKRQHVERNVLEAGGSQADGIAAARDFFENTCMRAVNQSIGRAIRHKNDYASVILIDERYSSDRIVRKLPNWIQKHSVPGTDTPLAVAQLRSFFASKAPIINNNGR